MFAEPLQVFRFLFVVGLATLAGVGLFYWPAAALLAGIVAIYGGAVLFEALRLGKGFLEPLKLIPYILVGNLGPGVGAVVAFVVGDSIRSYRHYNNED